MNTVVIPVTKAELVESKIKDQLITFVEVPEGCWALTAYKSIDGIAVIREPRKVKLVFGNWDADSAGRFIRNFADCFKLKIDTLRVYQLGVPADADVRKSVVAIVKGEYPRELLTEKSWLERRREMVARQKAKNDNTQTVKQAGANKRHLQAQQAR